MFDFFDGAFKGIGYARYVGLSFMKKKFPKNYLFEMDDTVALFHDSDKVTTFRYFRLDLFKKYSSRSSLSEIPMNVFMQIQKL